MTTHITRFTPHQQIAIPHDLEDTLAIIEAAEPMVSQFSESKIGAELKIKELRNTICEMTPENRQKFHKIATYFRKSFDLEKPITVKDIEEQLLDIRGILFHPPVTIDPHIITLLNEGEKILTSNETFRTNKLALDKLDALLNLANNPELLETLNDRKTYIERSNYRQDQHLRQHTLSMIAFRDAFESSPGAAQEFEDKLYADILSLLNTPNFRNIRDRLEPSYPPRENQ